MGKDGQFYRGNLVMDWGDWEDWLIHGVSFALVVGWIVGICAGVF